MSVKNTGTVKFTLDPKRPPALTKKAKARLAALPDKSVDLTDIPATHGVAWKRREFIDSRGEQTADHLADRMATYWLFLEPQAGGTRLA